MKKTIIITAILLGTTMIYAQKSNSNTNGKEQIVSTEDPHNPLVNGIPYSQYKAQVQAEQAKRVAAEEKLKSQQKAIIENKLPIIKNDEKGQGKDDEKNNQQKIFNITK